LGQDVLVVAGGLALLLSAIGLYGLIAFLVSRRTRDIGLRIALGAVPARVAGAFIAGGMRAVLMGLVAGLAGAWIFGPLLDAWLVGVEAHDPGAFAIAGTAVLVIAVVACTIPARRAARVDPSIALRSDA
jgi:ABC-type antimicrobial peptide transport system permease subunit